MDPNHHSHHHKHVDKPKQKCPKIPLLISTNKLASHDHRKIKRDEWSDEAVSCLLEAYEARWVLRNRAKLKGQDWDDVANLVSSRGGEGETKSPKTRTQCKNKIESMKKRYRSESAAAAATADAAATVSSSWPLFPRLNLLMSRRGSGSGSGVVPPPTPHIPLPCHNIHFSVPPLQSHQPPSPVAVVLPCQHTPNSRVLISVDLEAKDDGVLEMRQGGHQNSHLDADSSIPALNNRKEMTECTSNTNLNKTRNQNRRKRRRNRRWEHEVGESIKWFGEAMVRCEKARVEIMKELEKMRADAEEKRGEIELKMTQIVANTHMEIAKMFANAGTNTDSSLRN